MGFLIRWLINAVALWVTTKVVSGIEVTGSTTGKDLLTLLVVALIFGLVNAIIKPIVKLVGCVFYVLTLGLISFCRQRPAVPARWTGSPACSTCPSSIDGFWPAFWGAIVMGLVSWALSLVVPDRVEGKQ